MIRTTQDMHKSTMNKHTPFLPGLFLAGLACCSGIVLADTTVKDQATEGKLSYHALVIGHGCEDLQPGKTNPVKAQSVVFPTLKPVVTRADTGEALQWSDVIDDEAGTGLAGKVELIQDRNIFKAQSLILNEAGNSIGFYSTNGSLQADALGLVPFRFSAVSFAPATCARRLLIKLAIADICSMSFPPKVGTAGLWLPSTTVRFRDPVLLGDPATLIVNRDLVSNPLPAAQNCKDGFDVTIKPSAEDIDAHLPFKGWGRNR
ncbi:MAG: hypothetical protein ACR2HF_07315 [Methylococcaceae bacterium]